MLTIFFKSAFRSILRNKTLSLLNIGGLAIGMTVCFFIFQYVHFEWSYEDYNPNAANIYRVPLAFGNAAENDYVEATNYPAVGAAMKAEFPEVISFARMIPDEAVSATSMVLRKRRDGTIFSDNEKRFYIADPRILKMFSIPLIYGNDTDLNKMRGIFSIRINGKKIFWQ